MPKKVAIPVVGPSGLRIDDPDPRVSLVPLGIEGTEVNAPDPGDPFVVCFTDPGHFRGEWRGASDTARRAALENREFGIVIERAEILTQDTLDLVRQICQESGIDEVSIGVQRLR